LNLLARSEGNIGSFPRAISPTPGPKWLPRLEPVVLDFLELVPPAVAIRVGVVTNKKAAVISGP